MWGSISLQLRTADRGHGRHTESDRKVGAAEGSFDPRGLTRVPFGDDLTRHVSHIHRKMPDTAPEHYFNQAGSLNFSARVDVNGSESGDVKAVTSLIVKRPACAARTYPWGA